MSATPALAENSTFYNPILPGWHSDPSCTVFNGTFFCVTSTFIAFPGLPVYASKDLVNWKLASHVWNREAQLPGYSWATNGQQDGMYAATIRQHNGTVYVICEYLAVSGKDSGVLFRTTDPFDDASWSSALTFSAPKIDPDLFWNDDGKVYVATQGIRIQEMDITTGKMGPVTQLWNGTGGVWPEGPHIYKRPDGYYYLMIAEGGTAMNHAITISRSKNITGPYVPYAGNPILTNRGTDQYFQTVGHGDLFQDANGNWWGVALATRSGPAYKSYPMGRETVLYPATWKDGEWPILQPVRGTMSGWPLPPASRDVPGDGPFVTDPDVYDFGAGKPIPRNLMYWRVPREGAFASTDDGLRVVLSRNDVTGTPGGTEPAAKAISFIGRRQTHSLFTFSVDIDFKPTAANQEAGVVAFLTQAANLRLGIAREASSELSFRFTVENKTTTTAIPGAWVGKPIRLQIQMANSTNYTLAAMLASDTKTKVVVGTASAELLSGNTGSFVGTLIGVYATCNGAGSGLDCPVGTPAAYFQRWRYTGAGQYVSESETVPRTVDMAASEV
ncbi:glycosyl hydrolase [Echria macrotheca]|uniref:Glycosyl hydrolase n=1 Tax=Echria macrotheca TaxID=438768 RepID=A0AAJ0BKL6_9PEZI|nr:glycosyl hydrolase [Echria macrotheca]